MEALEAIMTRRSVRKFTSERVTDAHLETILRAAMAAPSASNGRPWRFVVVRDRERLVRLSKSTTFGGLLAGAGAGIVVCADRTALKYPGFWPIDTSAATENLLLAAHAIGLGGCWVGVHPIPTFKFAVRRAVGLPRWVVPVSLVGIGHPESVPAPVDRYEPRWVHHEQWGTVGDTTHENQGV